MQNESEKNPVDLNQKRRGRKPAAPEERKSRVIQTRVDEDLEETLKSAARSKRMSVSHLIRNVLEDTFDLVDGIVSDSSTLVGNIRRDARKIADSARSFSEREPAGDPKGSTVRPELDDIDSWQSVILNRDGQCIACHKPLTRGDQVYRGLGSRPGASPAWLCTGCLNNL